MMPLGIKDVLSKLRRDEKMATRVLVVDDAAFMRMMVKDILSKNG